MPRSINNQRTCILRIEDQFNQFVKDIKVEDLDVEQLEAETLSQNIINGVSEKIFSKYTEDMKEDTCKVYLYIPMMISKEDLLKAWRDRDVVKAKVCIDEILDSLTDEQKAALLSQYKTKN